MTDNLQELFGKSALLKILDTLDKNNDLTKKQMAEKAGVAESTVHRNWQTFEQLGLVREESFQVYSLDYRSDIVNVLFELESIVGERI